MAEKNTYTSGPFSVTEEIITDPDGKQWFDQTFVLSSRCRVPLSGQQREAQLKAERMNLHTMAEAIGQALESDDETNG